MPVTDHHGSFGRSLLSLRREQVHSVEATTDSMASDEVSELEAFQRQVADRFADLSLAGGEEILSLGWIRKLLDAFLFCQEEFRAIIHNHRSQLTKPPMDRLIGDYFDRSVKALDLCNAIREGIEQIKQWQKRIEIVINALVGNKNNQRSPGEGNFRRAKKALIDLAIVMQDEKESSTATGSPRNRSFGRNNKDTQQHHNHRTIGNFRSLSWSVSRSWSAARQLQAIGNNLTAPRAGDVTTTNGLAVPVYTMNSILLFVMWTLVAAIPCQDRGLNVHFCLPRHFQWAAPITSLHERILEESKKRGKKNVCGLLTEIYEIEKSSRLVCELVDSVQLPMTEEKESQLKHRMGQLVKVHDVLQESLDPLGSQVRDVFHRIVRIRTEGLHTPERSHNPER